MHYQHNGDTDGKLEMLGFVAEQLHTEKTANAAADGADAQKHPLRDTPHFFLCFYLVDEHKKEGCCIDYNKVWNQKFHNDFPF